MIQLIPTTSTGAGRISLFIVNTNGRLGGLFCLPESELWLVLVTFGIKRDIGLGAKISILLLPNPVEMLSSRKHSTTANLGR